MAKKCGHISLHNNKAFQCIQTWGVEHPHQDHSPEKRVKRGEAKEVPVTAEMVLKQMEEEFEVNEQIFRKNWIPYICKAIGKKYVKSHYLN